MGPEISVTEEDGNTYQKETSGSELEHGGSLHNPDSPSHGCHHPLRRRRKAQMDERFHVGKTREAKRAGEAVIPQRNPSASFQKKHLRVRVPGRDMG